MRTILYHSADHDGHCSGAIAKRWCIANNFEYNLVPINYGDKIPDLTGHDVILCDFSLQPEQIMIDAILKANTFTWIDHHISAIELFKTYSIAGLRSTEFAACELAWMYFFPDEKIPLGVTMLGAYDNWRHNEDMDILGYEWYNNSFDTDPKIFDWDNEVFQASPDIIYQQAALGAVSYRKDKQDWARQMKNSFEVEYQGLKALCLNTQAKSSMIFGDKLNNYDFVSVFYMIGSGKWKYTFYSASDKTDVSVLARQLGGGGHTHASGACLENFFWVKKD